jgi:acyl carrier protein
MTDALHTQLAAFIAADLLKQPGRQIGTQEPLISSGLVDSFSLVDLSLFIQDNFGVRIDDTELNVDTFDTIDQLAALVESRMS